MNDNNKTSSSFGSLLMGVAIGAVAATMMNKSTRKRVKETIMNALDEGDARMDELEDKADSLKTEVKKRAVKELDKTQRKIASTV